VKGNGPDKTAAAALGDFLRFPQWMWRNEVVVPFIAWMRAYNEDLMKNGGDAREKITFHGLDMYSLHKSASEVVKYLEKYDSRAAVNARKRYACFDRFGADTQTYALFTGYGMADSCEKEVLKVLRDLLVEDAKAIRERIKSDADGQREEAWVAKMNALLVKDAEEYYRCMMQEDVKTWNLRDTHMFNVLSEVIERHQGVDGKPAKAVVWAHNSHLGDARATDMGGARGELNVGQLCRENMGVDRVYNIGFLTSEGSVTAADDWDGPPHNMQINPAMQNSVERLLGSMREQYGDNYTVIVKRLKEQGGKPVKEEVDRDLSAKLNQKLLQRYIGVLYKPKTERWSHYSVSKLADQYDAACYIHETHALHPIDVSHHFPHVSEDVPDTFPFGV